MSGFPLLADERVDRAFVVALEANVYDVSVAHDDYSSGIADETLLERCQREERVILTSDDDFVRLARGSDHAGVIPYTNQGHAPAEIVRGVSPIDRHLGPNEIRDHVEWLENWL